MYVVATRIELSRLRQDGVEIEAFEELLSPNTVWLGPYSEIDARFMLGRLAGRRGQAPDEVAANRILISTGGHPGLLRTVFQLACDWPEDFENGISTDWRLQEECRRIWRSLDPDDQLVLLSLAHGENVPLASMDALRRKGLVGGPWARSGQIFSSLFAAFLREEHPVAGLHIHLDEQNRTVWVDGRKVQSLTRLEYHLISYLVKKRGEICTRDELAAHLYPEDMLPEGDSVSETRIDSLVKRLRKKIEPDPDNPHYLLTVRGHGLRLNDGGG